MTVISRERPNCDLADMVFDACPRVATIEITGYGGVLRVGVAGRSEDLAAVEAALGQIVSPPVILVAPL